jgi:hypothetical protein
MLERSAFARMNETTWTRWTQPTIESLRGPPFSGSLSCSLSLKLALSTDLAHVRNSVCACRRNAILAQRQLVKSALLDLCGNDADLREHLTNIYDTAVEPEDEAQGGAVSCCDCELLSSGFMFVCV